MMKRIVLMALMIALLISLASCVPQMALRPWYDEKDLVLEPGFAGTWNSVDDKGKVDDRAVFTIAQNLEKGYTISLEDSSQAGVRCAWEARLFRVNGQLFIDATQLTTKFNGDYVAELYIPGHMVGTVKLSADAVSLRFLDDEWMTKAVKANGKLIKNEMVDDAPVLTASTAELRAFALAHAGDEKAFSAKFDFLLKK